MEIKNILRIYHVFLNQSIGQDQYLTLMVILLENLQMLICLRRYFYRDSSNLYKPLITQLQYNICDLLRKSNARNFLEKYAMEHFRIYTNLNHTCPFSGHLYARNFTLDEVSIPPLPLQEYKLSIKFTQTNPSAFLGSVLLYFDATEVYHKKRPHRN
ncbi:uncharacterized protein LOC117568562 isoform X1 [Drosophila albomicans]|uniref:Uncharacterized protein LOC117568562 isoform X1 n=1 Tax=Drosophila albomicans TaxID=7291 RepID=A0A9C6WFK6_DROAB|nr:uncharacterized protein LOC117568562 isoform X1 [Drosophila albomicans]